MSKYSENMPKDLKTAIGFMYDHIKPGSVFLDFGCSTGYFGSLIKKAKNAQVYGVEISNDAAEARKVLDGVYEFDLDGDWPNEVYERKYDYAFFGDVLEHLKYPEKALKNTAKLLKPGGKVFVSIPNIAHISARLELLAGNFEYEPTRLMDNTHLKYFTLTSFTSLAKKAGYNLTLVDQSLNDYPKAVIAKWLEEVGLNAQDKFWKMTEAVEARAYQYKFILEPKNSQDEGSDDKSIKPRKPEQARDAYTDDLETKIRNLDDHARKQAEIIEHYIREKKSLEEQFKKLVVELEAIKQSLSYKTAQKIKKIISK